jgi:hypothetical protein
VFEMNDVARNVERWIGKCRHRVKAAPASAQERFAARSKARPL